MAKYLVTGGAGFIGSHIVDALVARGENVVVFDDLSSGSAKNVAHHGKKITFMQGDLRNPDAVKKATEGCDFVFHQAALASVPKSFERPHDFIDVNVKGTYNVFAAAQEARVKRVVWASSSAVYGDATKMPQREGEEGTCISPYAFTKKAGEDLARMFWKAHGLETVSLRYFNVFGPRQEPDSPYAAAIPKFIKAIANDQPPTIFGDGEQTRDFTYVANVVDANLRAMSAPAARVAGEVFNIALGKPTSVNQLIREISAFLGKKNKAAHLPPRQGDILHSCADISRAAAAFGMREFIPLKEGIKNTIEWHTRT